jgi:hypothetical protein
LRTQEIASWAASTRYHHTQQVSRKYRGSSLAAHLTCLDAQARHPLSISPMAHVYTDAIIVVPYVCVVNLATSSAPGIAGKAGRAGWVAQPRVTPVGVAQPFCRHWLPYIDLGHVDSQLLRILQHQAGQAWQAGRADRAGRAGRAGRTSMASRLGKQSRQGRQAPPSVTPVWVAQPLCPIRFFYSDMGHDDPQRLRLFNSSAPSRRC